MEIPPIITDPYIHFKIFKHDNKWFIHRRRAGYENWEYLNYHPTFEQARAQTAHLVDMVTHFYRLLAQPKTKHNSSDLSKPNFPKPIRNDSWKPYEPSWRE